ncbi:TetR/AcrR family transcriptional regulator [Sanguibacter suaedae]|uniref:TetR/AcrR family transcriptional regulator n=1 Tax=Sanguibacter suaedae TaxID=2795737 RepID=A0A934MAK0_9MICO|nr:TetR/AcrR family transcriptional regulator [Sanguibacter suaedae]MBI9115690.1 TetR/AcrR family transcriptional regulator [Sanguibacter suaedae]
MAWDTERTRRVILEAAVEEFAARGLAGSRVDSIAARAGTNKERLYRYFGSKEKLFDHVLAVELDALVTAVPATGTGTDGLADHAVAVLDFYATHPHLPRLLFWEGLERDGAAAEVARRSHTCQEQVDRLRVVEPCLTDTEARGVLLTITTLAAAWSVLPGLSRAVLGDGDAADPRAVLRATVTAMVATACAAAPPAIP